MAKITQPLTNTEVKQAKEKPYKLFDGAGLVLKVRVNGSIYVQEAIRYKAY